MSANISGPSGPRSGSDAERSTPSDTRSDSQVTRDARRFDDLLRERKHGDERGGGKQSTKEESKKGGGTEGMSGAAGAAMASGDSILRNLLGAASVQADAPEAAQAPRMDADALDEIVSSVMVAEGGAGDDSSVSIVLKSLQVGGTDLGGSVLQLAMDGNKLAVVITASSEGAQRVFAEHLKTLQDRLSRVQSKEGSRQVEVSLRSLDAPPPEEMPSLRRPDDRPPGRRL
jgi:hypothetical protein